MEIDVSLKELGWIVESLQKLCLQEITEGSNKDKDTVCKLLSDLRSAYHDAKTMSDSVGMGLVERVGGYIEEEFK